MDLSGLQNSNDLILRLNNLLDIPYREENFESIKNIVKQLKSDILIKNKDLFFSVGVKRDIRVLELFLTLGVDPNMLNEDGRCFLGYIIDLHNDASQLPHFYEKVNLLLKCGADINIKENSGKTPIFYSVEGSEPGKISKLNFLVENGADIKAKDNKGRGLIFYASESDKEKFVRLLELGLDINEKDNEGISIAEANQYFHSSFLTFLVKNGLKLPSNPIKLSEILAYQIGCHDDIDFECYNLLKDSGLCIAKNKVVWSSLIQSCRNSMQLNFLSKEGIRIDEEMYPLLIKILDIYYRYNPSRAKEAIKIIDFLLKNGFDINSPVSVKLSGRLEETKNYPNILFYSIERAFPLKIIQHIISAGCDINKEDNNGNTILWNTLMYYPQKALLKLLIDKGIDVKHKNKKGETVLIQNNFLDGGCNYKNNEAIFMLLDAGLDINEMDNDGNSALTSAISYTKNLKLIELLLSRNVNIQQNQEKFNEAVNKLVVSKGVLNNKIYKRLKEFVTTTNNTTLHTSELKESYLKNRRQFIKESSMEKIQELIKVLPKDEDFSSLLEMIVPLKGKDSFPLLKKNIKKVHHLASGDIFRSVASTGDVDMMTFLLQKMHYQEIEWLFSVAVAQDDFSTIDFLLKNNFISRKTLQDLNWYIESSESIGMLNFLLSKGAKLPYKIPEHLVSNTELIKFYFEKAKEYYSDRERASVLLREALTSDECQDLELVDFLIEHGADVNYKGTNNWYDKPILGYVLDRYVLLASKEKIKKIIHFVSKYKPSIDWISTDLESNGCTPFDMALKHLLRAPEKAHDNEATFDEVLPMVELVYTDKASNVGKFVFWIIKGEKEKAIRYIKNWGTDGDKKVFSFADDYILDNLIDNEEIIKKIITGSTKPFADEICKRVLLRGEEKYYKFIFEDFGFHPTDSCIRDILSDVRDIKLYEYAKKIGFDFNTTNNYGTTVLMAICRGKSTGTIEKDDDVSLAKFLLESGCKINEKDRDNMDALKLALDRQHGIDFIKLLLRYKPRFTLGEYGRSPLFYACVHSDNKSMIDLIVNSEMFSRKRESINKALSILIEVLGYQHNQFNKERVRSSIEILKKLQTEQ